MKELRPLDCGVFCMVSNYKSKAEKAADARWKAERNKRRRKRIEKEKTGKIQREKKRKEVSESHAWEYKTDEWAEMRERIIARDNGRCVSCFDKPDVIHIHHIVYEKGKTIWEIPDFYLVSLCKKCHYKEHHRNLFAAKPHPK